MNPTVTKSEFAVILGCSRAYVSQLVAAGRIVLVDDGKRVDVDASLALLGATSDPSKAGVRERWAEYRQQHQAATTPAPAAAAPVAAPAPAPVALQASLIDLVQAAADAPAAAAPAAAPTPAAHARSEYQDARTQREKAEAELAQIELLKARGRVLDADATLRAVGDAHTAVRAELLGLADRITPLVAAETNPRRVYELILAECEALCSRMQNAAARLAEKQRAEVAA